MHTAPISQVDIEEQLAGLWLKLEEATEEYQDLLIRAADAEADFKREWARNYLLGEGSEKARSAGADFKTDVHKRDYLIAESLAKSGRERLTTLRNGMDYLRTLNANVRSQVGPS